MCKLPPRFAASFAAQVPPTAPNHCPPLCASGAAGSSSDPRRSRALPPHRTAEEHRLTSSGRRRTSPEPPGGRGPGLGRGSPLALPLQRLLSSAVLLEAPRRLLAVGLAGEGATVAVGVHAELEPLPAVHRAQEDRRGRARRVRRTRSSTTARATSTRRRRRICCMIRAYVGALDAR